jgi:hypothetical protein
VHDGQLGSEPARVLALRLRRGGHECRRGECGKAQRAKDYWSFTFCSTGPPSIVHSAIEPS